MQTPRSDPIADFLACTTFAVVGASNQPHKFGAQVLAAYRRHGRRVHPVNPREQVVQGLACHPDLLSLPEPVEAVSIITPPAVTERVVEDAARAGVRFVWMQPGAESDAAITRARELGLTVIAGGPCLLVEIEARKAEGGRGRARPG